MPPDWLPVPMCKSRQPATKLLSRAYLTHLTVLVQGVEPPNDPNGMLAEETILVRTTNKSTHEQDPLTPEWSRFIRGAEHGYGYWSRCNAYIVSVVADDSIVSRLLEAAATGTIALPAYWPVHRCFQRAELAGTGDCIVRTVAACHRGEVAAAECFDVADAVRSAEGSFLTTSAFCWRITEPTSALLLALMTCWRWTVDETVVKTDGFTALPFMMLQLKLLLLS